MSYFKFSNGLCAIFQHGGTEVIALYCRQPAGGNWDDLASNRPALFSQCSLSELALALANTLFSPSSCDGKSETYDLKMQIIKSNIYLASLQTKQLIIN